MFMEILFRVSVLAAGIGAVFIVGVIAWLFWRGCVWCFVEVADHCENRRRQAHWNDMVDHPTYEETIASWGKIEPYNHEGDPFMSADEYDRLTQAELDHHFPPHLN